MNNYNTKTAITKAKPYKNTKTQEEFLSEVYELEGKNYKVMSVYKNAKTKITFKHVKCGNVYKVTPTGFLAGRRCWKCGRKKQNDGTRLTHEEFVRRVKAVHGNEYDILSEYKNALTKVKVRHTKCGHEYEVKPQNITKGNGCDPCGRKRGNKTRTLTHKGFEERVSELTVGDYEVIGKYKNTRTKVEMKHIECGRLWEIRPNDFITGARCPHCRESRGENAIYNYLFRNSYDYKKEYRIDNCRYIRPLPFDFAVFHQDELVCLIEFHGEQHYRPVDFWGGKEGFKERVKRDNIKKNYCNANNIKLIEIAHSEHENIETILDEKIKSIHQMKNIHEQQLVLF